MGDDKNQEGVLPARLAFYMSMLVWPGAGQFTQKRWLAGTFYAVVFLVCIVFMFITILTPLFWNLRMLASCPGKDEIPAFCPIPFMKIMVWTAVSALVYLSNLLDTFVYFRRQHRRPAAGLQEKGADSDGTK